MKTFIHVSFLLALSYNYFSNYVHASESKELDTGEKSYKKESNMSNDINTIVYLGDANALVDFFKSGGTTDGLKGSYIERVAKEGDLETLKILYSHGANFKNSNSGDLLIAAVGNENDLGEPLQENLAVTKFLIEKVGIDVDAEDSIFTGRTALFRAAKLLYVDTVKYLVSQGANADKYDDGYVNALWYAVDRNITTSTNGVFHTDFPEFIAIAEFLLEHGASIHRQSGIGDSVLRTVVERRLGGPKLRALFASVEAPTAPNGFYLTLREKNGIGYELEDEENDGEISDQQIVIYLKSETIPLDSLNLDQRYRVLQGFVRATDIRDVVSRLQVSPSMMEEFLLLSVERLPTSDWNRVESLMALNKHLANSDAVKQINTKSLDDEYENLRWEANSYFEAIENIN